MAEITTYQSTTVTDLMARIGDVSTNPSLAFRASMDVLDEAFNGDMEIVDPTNPLVFLMSSSAVHGAANIQEGITLLRQQYPSLAQTSPQLYHHMYDRAFLDRFAQPASTLTTMVIDWQQLTKDFVRDEAEGCGKAIIPRDTTITVDGVVFMCCYPVEIRYYDNGLLKVSYDNSIDSPFQDLTTNIITARLRTDTAGIPWLFFDIEVIQLDHKSINAAVHAGKILRQDIPFTDKFHSLRAFYQKATTGSTWHEMKVSHSDVIYNAKEITMGVKVNDQVLTVSLPTVYQQQDMLDGAVRIDVFTTKGLISYNFQPYKPDAFEMDLTPIDRVRDLTAYSQPFATTSYYGMINQTVNGGREELPFDTLQEQVIANSIGIPTIPITPDQAPAFVGKKNFQLVTGVDKLTGRIFLATQKLPQPSNPKLLTAANVGISTVILEKQQLVDHEYVRVNDKRWTLLAKNLYQSVNGIVRLLRPAEIDTLKAKVGLDLTTALNDGSYFYSPFYYVLDNSAREFSLRGYHLDAPVAANLNFQRQNQTHQLIVNTGSYQFSKTETGYRLDIKTSSGKYYKELADGVVHAQIGIYPPGETRMAYLTGTLLGKDADEERVFRFELVSNHDINETNAISFDNLKFEGIADSNVFVALQSLVHVFYTTTSIVVGFKPDLSDTLIAKTMLPSGSHAITYEQLDLTFGVHLKNLWSRSRSLPTGDTYERHTQDVLLRYTEDVYTKDPVTGSIFSFVDGEIAYNILHRAGDQVYNEDGTERYKHRIGDVVLDNQGNPVVQPSTEQYKEIDLLFVDGRHYFVSDDAYLAYNTEFTAVLVEWVTQDLADVQPKLLELTRIFFYPKNQLGQVQANLPDEESATLVAQQSLVLDLDVPDAVYRDETLREQLRNKAIRLLDNNIGLEVVNSTVIEGLLMTDLGTSVKSLRLSGLGGERNLRIISLPYSQDRLCLKRNLSLQQDNTLIMKEDVTVEFHLVK